MSLSEYAKICVSLTQNIKFTFPLTQNPNAKGTSMLVSFALGEANFVRHPTQNPISTQWNIGCVGSLALGLCVGHVHFIFFVLISFVLGSRRKRSFQWNMGLKFKTLAGCGCGALQVTS